MLGVGVDLDQFVLITVVLVRQFLLLVPYLIEFFLELGFAVEEFLLLVS